MESWKLNVPNPPHCYVQPQETQLEPWTRADSCTAQRYDTACSPYHSTAPTHLLRERPALFAKDMQEPNSSFMRLLNDDAKPPKAKSTQNSVFETSRPLNSHPQSLNLQNSSSQAPCKKQISSHIPSNMGPHPGIAKPPRLFCDRTGCTRRLFWLLGPSYIPEYCRQLQLQQPPTPARTWSKDSRNALNRKP